jgi:hypothetical protein
MWPSEPCFGLACFLLPTSPEIYPHIMDLSCILDDSQVRIYNSLNYL